MPEDLSILNPASSLYLKVSFFPRRFWGLSTEPSSIFSFPGLLPDPVPEAFAACRAVVGKDTGVGHEVFCEVREALESPAALGTHVRSHHITNHRRDIAARLNQCLGFVAQFGGFGKRENSFPASLAFDR